jgi:hypothetical protein
VDALRDAPRVSCNAFWWPPPDNGAAHPFESRRRGFEAYIIIYVRIRAWQKWTRYRWQDDSRKANQWLELRGKPLLEGIARFQSKT